MLTSVDKYVNWFRIKALMSVRSKKDFDSIIEIIDTRQLKTLQEKYKSDT